MQWTTSLVVIVLLVLLGGCNVELGEWSTTRRAQEDAWPDQPWIGVDEKAVGRISFRRTPMDVFQWLEWKVSDDEWVEAREVARRAREYLSDGGAWEGLGLQRTDYGEEEIVKVKKTLLVTALDPAVVLIGRGETLYLEDFGGGTLPHQMEARLPDGTHSHPVGILPYGFRYGTTLPYSPDLQWFSPDLEIGPKPVEMISDDKGRIEVPWGYLMLTRDDNKWVVTTSSK